MRIDQAPVPMVAQSAKLPTSTPKPPANGSRRAEHPRKPPSATHERGSPAHRIPLRRPAQYRASHNSASPPPDEGYGGLPIGRGLLNLATCFDAAVGGNVVNQSLRQYNDFDQLTAEYQAHGDAVNVGTTPMVGYSYADGAANTVRAVGLEYPNGRQVEFNYGAAGGDGDRLSRVARRYGADWATPEYDRAGNMTVIPKPENPTTTFTGTYDAWNRLVHLSGIDATYRYDAFNRRVTKLVDSTERHFYYTADWQCIEERLDSSPNPDRQYVWGLRYIDDLILRDRDTDSSGTLDERLYALQDANWNVTAIVDDAGDVVERYGYTAYGAITFLTTAFLTQEYGGVFCWEFFFTSQLKDTESRFYSFRYRYLSPYLGAFLTPDPRRYSDGTNAYRAYFISNGVDPFGLQAATTIFSPAKVESHPWRRGSWGGNNLAETTSDAYADCKCRQIRLWCLKTVDLGFATLPIPRPSRTAYSFECTAKLYTFIKIDVQKLNYFQQHVRGDITLQGQYGHEQRHVISLRNKVSELANTVLRKQIFPTMNACNQYRTQQLAKFDDEFKAFEQREIGHANPDSPKTIRGMGVEYAPIGNMPAPS